MRISLPGSGRARERSRRICWPRRRAGPLRAEALLLLAEFEHDDLAVPVLEEALREASSNPALQAAIHIRLARAERFRKGFAAALEGTRTALELADRLDDDVLRFEALVQLHFLGGMVGDAETPGVRRARARARHRRRRRAPAAGGERPRLRDALRLRRASTRRRAVLEREYREWQERDELFCAERALGSLVDRALGRSLGARGGPRRPRPRRQRPVRGREEPGLHPELVGRRPSRAARARSGGVGARPEALRGADRIPSAPAPGRAGTRRALERRRGHGRRASSARPTGRRRHSGGVRRTRARGRADYAEALLELGRVDEAVRVIDRWEADASAARPGAGARARDALPRARRRGARSCRRGSRRC